MFTINAKMVNGIPADKFANLMGAVEEEYGILPEMEITSDMEEIIIGGSKAIFDGLLTAYRENPTEENRLRIIGQLAGTSISYYKDEDRKVAVIEVGCLSDDYYKLMVKEAKETFASLLELNDIEDAFIETEDGIQNTTCKFDFKTRSIATLIPTCVADLIYGKEQEIFDYNFGQLAEFPEIRKELEVLFAAA